MGIWPRGFLITRSWVRFSLACFGVLVLIIAVGLYFQYREIKSVGNRLSTAAGIANPLLEDPDHDGLKNWEEALYHTDPNNPDTDGDGVSDGDEVKMGCDPLVKGCGTKAAAVNSAAPAPIINETNTLTKSLIDKGILGSTSGDPSQNLSQAELVSLTADYPKARDQYVAAEVKKVHTTYDETNSTDVTKTYLNGVADAYYTSYKDVKKSDLEAVAEASNYDFDMAPLDPYIAATQNLKTTFLLLKPPISLKVFHEKGLQVIFEALFDLRALRNAKPDPFAALIALQYREATRLEISQLYDTDLAAWVKQSKITFTDNEIGHLMFGW